MKQEKMDSKKTKIKDLNNLVEKATEYFGHGYDVVSTGILPLDIKLKTGGYLRGRLVEIYGDEHTGKTLMSMLACKEEQIRNKESVCLFVDTEASFDAKWFKILGGDLDRLDIFNPYQYVRKNDLEISGELVFDRVIDLIGSGKYPIVVLDSYMGPCLLSKEILAKDMEETERIGVQAKLNNNFARRASLQTMRTDTTLIITNHLIEKIGVMFGNPESTPGGKKLKFYSEQRLRIGTPKEKSTDGHILRGGITKNKRGASAGLKFETYLSYEYGIDNYAELTKMLIKEKMVSKEEKDSIYKSMKKDYNVFQGWKDKMLEKVSVFNQTGDGLNDGLDDKDNEFEED